MSFLPITAIWLAIGALGLVALSVPVAVQRKKGRTSLGDGGDAKLQRRVRAQANYAEYVPLALLMLAFVEAGGWSGWIVWTLGGLLAAGRLMHASAIYSATLGPRVFGMLATWGVLVVSAVLILIKAAQAL